MSVKRPRSESLPKVMSPPFTLDILPEDHFHLGDDLFATVQNFNQTARVHLRHFTLSDIGEYTPSRNGVALPPFLWQALAESMDTHAFVNLPSQPDEFSIVRNSLFLSTVYSEKEQAVCITAQRFYKRRDHSAEFLPGVCVLNQHQWGVLKSLRARLTEMLLAMMYGPLLRYKVLAEAYKQPTPMNELSEEIAQEMLSSSMVDILCALVTRHIQELFKCTGCQENYANQLGHECMTYERGLKAEIYFNLALTKVNLGEFVSEFVRANSAQRCHIRVDYMRSVKPEGLISSVRDMYIANCPLNYLQPDPLNMAVRSTLL